MNSKIEVARYILTEEYQCPCCKRLPPDLNKISETVFRQPFEELFSAFRKIRELWGEPILITSGYRCPVHNQKIGGELASVHQFGLALDLDCPHDQDMKSLAWIVNNNIPDLRMGIYKERNFIHIDVGYLIFPRMSTSWIRGARWYG